MIPARAARRRAALAPNFLKTAIERSIQAVDHGKPHKMLQIVHQKL